jgi:hypothetical protein
MNIMWHAADIREENRIEYQHRQNVLTFPGPHAKSNAAYAAQLLEADRRETRRAEIRVLIESNRLEIERRAKLIQALRIEDQLLEAPSHV